MGQKPLKVRDSGEQKKNVSDVEQTMNNYIQHAEGRKNTDQTRKKVVFDIHNICGKEWS